jgi:transcription-repair coupling factor (superfamily II helicase)
VEFELRDRFGPAPPELDNFFSVLSFKRHLADWGVSRADIHEINIRLHFDERQIRLDPAVLLAWVQASKGRARIQPPAVLDYVLEGEDLSARLASAYEDLLPVLGGA